MPRRGILPNGRVWTQWREQAVDVTIELDIPTRKQSIEAHKTNGGRIAAVFPIHYPRALFRAHRLLPVEVWGPPSADVTLGDAHLQSYTCSIVRNGLAYAIAGGLDAADLFVVPHCCDSLQGLGSLLIDFIHCRQPTFPLYLPRDHRSIDVEFFAQEIKSLSEKLAGVSGCHPSDTEVAAAIEQEQLAVVITQTLVKQRESIPQSDRAFHTLLRSREYLPAEHYTALAQTVLDAPPAAESRWGIPLILAGVVPEPMSLFDVLEGMGARVVGDDFLSTERRCYPASASDDPWRNMAESILNGPPDSTRGSTFEARLSHLRTLAQTRSAAGVIFYQIKFCEPEQFYYPMLKQGLEAIGIPSILLEVELGEPLGGQVVTRLEAFVEQLS